MAAGFAALHHENIDTGLDLTDRMLLGADQCRNRHTMALAKLDHRWRRYAKCIGDELDRVPEGSFEHFERLVGIIRCGALANRFGRRCYIVALQKLRHEIAVLLRYAGRQRAGGHALLAAGRQIFRDQHVEPIGFAIDVLVDPIELDLDARGGVAGGAQHAEPAGAAHCRDYIAAMAEGEQRKFNAESCAQS